MVIGLARRVGKDGEIELENWERKGGNGELESWESGVER